jgi:hypothetical protein
MFLLRLLTSALGTKLLNARALVCPEELAKADMRPFRRDSAFDPKRSSVGPKSRTAAPAGRPKSAILSVTSTGHWVVKRHEFIAVLGLPVVAWPRVKAQDSRRR